MKITLKNLKKADVVITMSWGKTMWWYRKLKVPEVQNLKLIHLPGAGTDAINFSQLPKNCKFVMFMSMKYL